jgi:hypothetical protein
MGNLIGRRLCGCICAKAPRLLKARELLRVATFLGRDHIQGKYKILRYQRGDGYYPRVHVRQVSHAESISTSTKAITSSANRDRGRICNTVASSGNS